MGHYAHVASRSRERDDAGWLRHVEPRVQEKASAQAKGNHELTQEIFVPRPLAEVFEFFGAAENLQELTPTFLEFKILTSGPIKMGVGTLIDYRIRLGGWPMKWRTLISEWAPPHRFVDDQLKGPYLLWHHEHDFEEANGGTWIRDRVTYRAPGWFLEPIIHRAVILPRLKAIFEFRRRTIEAKFGPPRP